MLLSAGLAAGGRKSSGSGAATEAAADGGDKTEASQHRAGIIAQTLLLAEYLPRSPLFCAASTLLLVALHAAKALVTPPAHLPWLWDRAFTTVGFGYLAVIAAHLQLAQWRLGGSEGSRRKRKHKVS